MWFRSVGVRGRPGAHLLEEGGERLGKVRVVERHRDPATLGVDAEARAPEHVDVGFDASAEKLRALAAAVGEFHRVDARVVPAKWVDV